MAIYKPSNCTPFLSSVDLRQPFNITCELSTSNERVTGYKIKVLDNNNNLVFEGKDFDPIPGGNSGLNGSTLVLPFLFVDIDPNTVTLTNAICYYHGIYVTKTDHAEFHADRFKNGYLAQPYKYIITLAQGQQKNGSVLVPGTAKYFDIEVTSGTVIGSTPNRIQSYLSENIYKDYFIQLYQAEETGETLKPISRQLITSYDRTYGYIYPQENKFTKDDIGAAQYFQIYKNSNDPTVISSAYQIDFAVQGKMEDVIIKIGTFGSGVSGQLNLADITQFYTENNKTKMWKAAQSVEPVEWYLGIGDSDGSFAATQPICFKFLGDDDTATLSIEYSNAMVLCSSYNSLNPVQSNLNESDGSYYNGIKGLKFNTEYYVSFNVPLKNGVPQSRVVRLLTTDVESYFYIKPEDEWKTEQYPYYFTQSYRSVTSLFPKIEDYDSNFSGVLQIGMNAVVKNEGMDNSSSYNGVFTLQAMTNEEGMFVLKWLRNVSYNTWATLNSNPIYVKNGTDRGKVFQGDGDLTGGGEINITNVKIVDEKPIEIYSDTKKGYNNSLTKGQIFKNTDTETYIRPFVGIQEEQKFIYSDDGWVSSSDRTIEEIDTTKWSIKTESLTKPLTPDKDKYKITSYFKSSDENPFYAYSTPSVKINENIFKKDEEANLLIDTPTAYFTGTFTQSDNKAWVFYYWELIDTDNEYHEVSEKQYNGEIAYTYNGLQNERNYKIILYVEDEFGNTYSDSKYFKVKINYSEVEKPFKCELDCKTNSYLFNFGVSQFLVKKDLEGTQHIPFLANNEYFFVGKENPGSIFRQEIDIITEGGKEVIEELTPFKLISETNIERDFNIANGRTYRYRFYPDPSNGQNIKPIDIIPPMTNWQNWSITELHPIDNSYKSFIATKDDVWLFNLNVSTGEQTQNIIRNEQQTLGQYKSYAQGKSNYISGSVNCLLGPDVLPASYIIKNGKSENVGGYREYRSTIPNPTSNERVDMLKAWRKLVYSSNPKLLKDRAGQSFLITINNSGNTPMDNVRRQPNTISFGWTQIGDTDDITVVEKEVKEELYRFVYNFDKTEIVNIISDDPLRVTAVTIPSTVTKISAKFILFQNLTDIYFEGDDASAIKWGSIDGLRNIMDVFGKERRLFVNNKLVTEVISSDDAETTIKECAFMNCKDIVNVELNGAVTSIGYGAFAGCSGLTSATIGNSVTSIGESAFKGCNSLESITLPFIGASKTANSGYDQVFGYIFGFMITSSSSPVPDTTYQYADGNNTYYHYYIPASLKTVILSNDVEITIGDSAFKNCSGLTNVTIPDSVTSIGRGAFSGCSSLTSVTIPNSVISIGDNAFYGCNSVSKITLQTPQEPATLLTIGLDAFRLNKPGETELNVYLLNLNDYIEHIELNNYYSSPFSGKGSAASNLYINGILTKSLYFEANETIPQYAFAGANIETLDLITPQIGEVGSVGFGAFQACPISKINLGFTGKSRKDEDIYNSKRSYFGWIFGATKHDDQNRFLPNNINVEFQSITYGEKKVVQIADNAFYGCTKLKRITINETWDSKKQFICGENAFAGIVKDGDDRSIELSFGEGVVDSIGYVDSNSVFDKIRYFCQQGKFENEYSSPACCAVLGCEVSNEFVPFNVLKIAPETLPLTKDGYVDSMSITSFAFAHLRIDMINIAPQENKCYIARGSFYKSKWKQFFSESRIDIGSNCIIDDFDMNHGTNSGSGYGSFSECGFRSVAVEGTFDPNADGDVGAFEKSLIATVSASRVSIPKRCFRGCTSLSEVAGLITLLDYSGSVFQPVDGDGAFQGCTSLSSIQLDTTNIPAYTFKGCSELSQLNVRDVPEIWIPYGGFVGDYAFYGCGKIAKGLRIRGVVSGESESYSLGNRAFDLGHIGPNFYVSAPTPQTIVVGTFTQTVNGEDWPKTAIVHIQPSAESSWSSATIWRNNTGVIEADYVPET